MKNFNRFVNENNSYYQVGDIICSVTPKLYNTIYLVIDEEKDNYIHSLIL